MKQAADDKRPAPVPYPGLESPHLDQRVHLHGISRSEYESLLAMRGEHSGVRITYLEGELELMTPSIDHEALTRQNGGAR